MKQIYEALNNPLSQNVLFRIEPEVLAAVKELHKTELKRLAIPILQAKFTKYYKIIREIIKTHPLRTNDSIVDMLDKIFVMGSFIVVDDMQIAKSEGGVFSCSNLIAQYIIELVSLSFFLDNETLENYLTDFIKEREDYLVIDLNNEFEVYKSQSMKQFIDNDEFLATLKKSIAKYNELLNEQYKQGVDTRPTENLLRLLNRQYENHLAGRSFNALGSDYNMVKTYDDPSLHKSFKPRKEMVKDQMYLSTLKEIFVFYNRQGATALIRKTFDEADEETSKMLIGYFMRMLKDFEIAITLEKQRSIFIKHATGGKYLLFEQFVEAINQVAIEWNEQKVKEIKGGQDLAEFRIRRNNKKLEKVISLEGDQSPEAQRLRAKIDLLKKTLNEHTNEMGRIKGKDDEELKKDLCLHMGIGDSSYAVLLFMKFSIEGR